MWGTFGRPCQGVLLRNHTTQHVGLGCRYQGSPPSRRQWREGIGLSTPSSRGGAVCRLCSMLQVSRFVCCHSTGMGCDDAAAFGSFLPHISNSLSIFLLGNPYKTHWFTKQPTSHQTKQTTPKLQGPLLFVF